MKSKLPLAALSLALSLSVLWAALIIVERTLGMEDPWLRYENQVGMWQNDTEIGYTNRPRFDGVAWGSVPIQTNEYGFRGPDSTPLKKAKGVLRIIGLGDSVMWGTGVAAESSVLGQLKERLETKGPVEVINAGVVGYSSLQELLLLQRTVLPLEPDIILLNFCGNDILPTEDPFRGVRAMVLRYLQTLLEADDASLTSAERAGALHLVQILESDNNKVWDDLDSLSTEERDGIQELLMYRPLARMTTMARSSGARMIVMLIPGAGKRDEYLRYLDRVTEVVETSGGEVVSVVADLPQPPRSRHNSLATRALRLVPRLNQFLIWRDLPSIHETELFLDRVHPTKRGNGIIAERVFQHLRGDAPGVNGSIRKP